MKLSNGLEIIPCDGKYFAYDIKAKGEYNFIESIGHIERCEVGYKLILNTKKHYILNYSYREFYSLTDLLCFLRKIRVAYNCVRQKIVIGDTK